MNHYQINKNETNSALHTGIKCDCNNKTFYVRAGSEWVELVCTQCNKSETWEYNTNNNN